MTPEDVAVALGYLETLRCDGGDVRAKEGELVRVVLRYVASERGTREEVGEIAAMLLAAEHLDYRGWRT